MAGEGVLLDVVHQFLDLSCIGFLAFCGWQDQAEGCNCVKQVVLEILHRWNKRFMTSFLLTCRAQVGLHKPLPFIDIC